MDRLSSHRATKDVVEKHGFKFSKSLGQNFLIDDNVIDRILAGARLSEGDKIIEVGPGIGTLTREMGKVADKVVAIEIDKTLIPILRETLGEFDNIEVVNQDILKILIVIIKDGTQISCKPSILYNNSNSYEVLRRRYTSY